MKLNTIEEALEDLKNNKVIIVVDDENRENEGDFIFPAENITPEVVNFMATHGRGLICVPLTSIFFTESFLIICGVIAISSFLISSCALVWSLSIF